MSIEDILLVFLLGFTIGEMKGGEINISENITTHLKELQKNKSLARTMS